MLTANAVKRGGYSSAGGYAQQADGGAEDGARHCSRWVRFSAAVSPCLSSVRLSAEPYSLQWAPRLRPRPQCSGTAFGALRY